MFKIQTITLVGEAIFHKSHINMSNFKTTIFKNLEGILNGNPDVTFVNKQQDHVRYQRR